MILVGGIILIMCLLIWLESVLNPQKLEEQILFSVTFVPCAFFVWIKLIKICVPKRRIVIKKDSKPNEKDKKEF